MSSDRTGRQPEPGERNPFAEIPGLTDEDRQWLTERWAPVEPAPARRRDPIRPLMWAMVTILAVLNVVSLVRTGDMPLTAPLLLIMVGYLMVTRRRSEPEETGGDDHR